MKISEIFHSIQGEGIHTGRWATLVRFAGCNLRCDWCDTKYSWDRDSAMDMGTDDVVRTILDYQADSVIFTGGEPLLFQEEVYGICEAFGAMFKDDKLWFGIETNGLIRLESPLVPHIDHIAISPKLPSAVPVGFDFDALVWWCFHCEVPSKEFKFTVCDRHDLRVVEQLVQHLYLKESTIPVILQPNGQRKDYAKAARELFTMVNGSSLRNYARIMLQSHRVIWGGERGK